MDAGSKPPSDAFLKAASAPAASASVQVPARVPPEETVVVRHKQLGQNRVQNGVHIRFGHGAELKAALLKVLAKQRELGGLAAAVAALQRQKQPAGQLAAQQVLRHV